MVHDLDDLGARAALAAPSWRLTFAAVTAKWPASVARRGRPEKWGLNHEK
jgi:hypothetical protein